MSPVLRFTDVACWRGGRLLFEGVSFALDEGEALWVRGPNGSGKSSLIRLAAGLLSPAAGSIASGEAALADESLALDREQSLERALRFWARLDDGTVWLEGALQAFELDHLAQVPVRMLSTGQARRARLARVVASGAPLWLLDEPVNGLDERSIGLLGSAIASHRAAGGAVLAASHVPLPGGEWRTLELHA
ncbi:heme ABC exporter ATP-binding protein CcmA [Sphingomonas arenae]|uniref:heme ABC exporter ATP-binding protein CcmA n=1 Tax=Sphingomonas arenae TaxID=2812555 RepID=UPI0019672019|nr:heme ABC exporter ATP-binding protein CcmA [Sphingomonas arenae]